MRKMHLFTATTAAAVIVSAAVPASAIEIGNVVKSQKVQWSQQIQGVDFGGIHVLGNGNIVVPAIKESNGQQQLTVVQYNQQGGVVSQWQKTLATGPHQIIYKNNQLVVMPKAQNNIENPLEIIAYSPTTGEKQQTLGIDSEKNIYTVSKNGIKTILDTGGVVNLTSAGVTQVTGSKAVMYDLAGKGIELTKNPLSFETVGYDDYYVEVAEGKDVRLGKLVNNKNQVVHSFVTKYPDDYTYEDGVLVYKKYVSNQAPVAVAFDTRTAQLYDAPSEAYSVDVTTPRVAMLNDKGLPIHAYERLRGSSNSAYSYVSTPDRLTYSITYTTTDLTYYVDIANEYGAITNSIPIYRKSVYGTEQPAKLKLYGASNNVYLAITDAENTNIYALSDTKKHEEITVPAQKTWVITFNEPIKEQQAITNYISVKSQHGLMINNTTRVSPDGLRLYIHAPTNGYAPGSYELSVMKGLLSEKGKAIKINTTKKFNVK